MTRPGTQQSAASLARSNSVELPSYPSRPRFSGLALCQQLDQPLLERIEIAPERRGRAGEHQTSARTLNRARGFAATAILIVALGVGANTAAFSLTDFVLFRPLPFPKPDRLVTFWQSQGDGGYTRMELTPSNYHDWRAAAASGAISGWR